MLVTLDDVRAAAHRIAGSVLRTPLLTTASGPLWIKPENLQPTGAFKLRGAMNAVLQLDPAVRGVITHSSGNHGQALAYAGRAAGLQVTVVVPDGAVAAKVHAIQALGAHVVAVPYTERAQVTQVLAAERGLTFVAPYDDPHVIAGQGTVGLEIVQDLPDVDVVLVPIGGGGLASGVATAVTALGGGVGKSRAVVIGVEPECAADAAESMRRGERVAWDPRRTARTAADGVRHAVLGELTWQHLRQRLHAVVTVTEEDIAVAVRFLAASYRLVAEPSGALATAAFLRHRDELPAGHTVAVVSGGNV